MTSSEQFLSERLNNTPTVGRWSSGFTAVKEFADSNEIPMIGMWTRATTCGSCTNTKEMMLRNAFKNWMAECGCVFWCGTDADTSQDDKEHGTGEKWIKKNANISKLPFIRVWWEKGGVNMAMEGDYLRDKKVLPQRDSGTYAVSVLSNLLKGFDPKGGGKDDEPDPPQPDPPEPDPPTPEPHEGAFDMFGLGHDCMIITKDNKLIKYTNSAKKLEIVGDYDPYANLSQAELD